MWPSDHTLTATLLADRRADLSSRRAARRARRAARRDVRAARSASRSASPATRPPAARMPVLPVTRTIGPGATTPWSVPVRARRR